MLATRPKPSNHGSQDYPTPPSDSNSDHKPIWTRQRKKAPKTRGGCITCKKRRVKCDEAKPFCRRCLKLGDEYCEGYASSGDEAASKKRLAVLAPAPMASSSSPEHIVQSPLRFKNENESRFYGFYLQEVALLIAGPMEFEDKTSLWSRLIPQACESEPYIRQLVVSLGAIGQVSRTQTVEADRWVLQKSYQFALDEYAKALNGMRNAIETKNHDMRHALLACLLIFCLETMQGNAQTAARHARSGLNLLHEWMSKSRQQKAGRDFILQQQAQQLDMDIYNGPGDITESTKLFEFYGFEPDIFNAFAALEIQIWASVKEVPGKGIIYLGRLHEALLGNMPVHFDTLAQSRQCWLKIRSMNYQYKVHVSENSPDRLQLQPTIERMARWFCASANVFEKVESSGSYEEKIYLKRLKIEACSEFVLLSGSGGRSEEEYPALAPMWQTIVDLCEEIYPSFIRSQNSPSKVVDGGLFSFDVGTIQPLRIVAQQCRDATTRDRAFALLSQSCYREGLFDAQATAWVMNWYSSIKEKMKDSPGFDTKDKRIVMTRHEVEPGNKTITLACRTLAPGKDRWRYTETLDWNFGPGRPAGIIASDDGDE